ncbi:HlyD family type I secretion periplasmic adaptor subunit [Devosia riboflavina]|uniref:HlyD family type I secretion periplasmic adaptor subunit n=1 Tax=Devosia riboflavina TaxID=46914 RepID=UPI000A016E3D|nr:HlyD family type I secretion periplasmic adaptor subunit [Devosia riboflavina]
MNAPFPVQQQSPAVLQAPPPPRSWLYVVVIISIFAVIALLWASWAEVDEISRAEGRVIPSGKTQIIQAAEAGVVTDILVRAGEQVRQGQQLIQLDDTNTASSAGEVEARVLALLAQTTRLRAESQGLGVDAFICPAEITVSAPEVCDSEIALMTSRAASLEQGMQVLAQRVEQRQRELGEASANATRLGANRKIAQERLALMEPLAAKGLVAQTAYLDAQREVGDLNGQIAAVAESVARIEAALREAQLQVDQATLQFRQDALAELTVALAQLASTQQQLRGAEDRVRRTDIRSPVDGVVNTVEINTIGGVVAAGEKLLDIVPISDVLLVEARLRPSDVAFIIPGQEARIKLTAYDYSIYGGLTGRVTNVSADSMVDPNTRETYYIVQIRADKSVLEYRGRELPVLPGMVTTVDILTGKRTVLQYLLKPINKVRQEAFSER